MYVANSRFNIRVTGVELFIRLYFSERIKTTTVINWVVLCFDTVFFFKKQCMFLVLLEKARINIFPTVFKFK